MAAPKKKTRAPSYPEDGRFRDLVEMFLRTVYSQRTGYTKARMLKALDKVKAEAGELTYPEE